MRYRYTIFIERKGYKKALLAFIFLSSFFYTGKLFAETASSTVTIATLNAEVVAGADLKAKNDLVEQALRDKITQKNTDLIQIQSQIDTYTKWLNSAQDESKTLQGAIKTLDVERQKMTANITLTQNKLDNTALTIQEISMNIADTETKINMENAAISEVMRTINQSDAQSLLETVLSQDKLSHILDDGIELASLREKISEQVSALKKYKEDSLIQKSQKEAENKKLAGYKSDLVDQKIILDKAKKEKNDVLLATRNKESSYQKILADNLARKNALEKDLAAYENQLTRQLDNRSIPKAVPGSLLWPLDLPVITQHFGVTKDSVRLYASGTHNGTDLRASRGTPVTSPAPGVVTGVGDTDLVCPKASYGKWILIKHDNGLTTLMGHLDLIKVTQGQEVSAGELIGYSGNTGYATGPHLHISLFASDGVTVATLPSKSCSGKTFIMPLPTAKNAYLDPEAYFPKI